MSCVLPDPKDLIITAAGCCQALFRSSREPGGPDRPDLGEEPHGLRVLIYVSPNSCFCSRVHCSTYIILRVKVPSSMHDAITSSYPFISLTIFHPMSKFALFHTSTKSAPHQEPDPIRRSPFRARGHAPKPLVPLRTALSNHWS